MMYTCELPTNRKPISRVVVKEWHPWWSDVGDS